jgi:hypothetical protein
MSGSTVDRFRAVWIVDFEFTHLPSGKPDVVCLAAKELRSRWSIALWRDEIGPVPPYDTDADAVVVFYSGSEAELACHLALGWPLPANVVDLIVEYRMAINGHGGKHQLSMLDACARFGVPVRTSPAEKDRTRARILQGPPFSDAERSWILDYCRSDVEEEAGLLRALQPEALSPHAVWRGRFIKTIARMWWRGVPIDPRYVTLATDPSVRLALKQAMVADLQADFPVFDGTTLKNALLADFMETNGIPVPRTPTGRTSISQDQLGRLARDYPILVPLVESLRTQAQLRDFSLPIGSDFRLRAWFAPFLTITSRAAPPTNGYIYNLPAWMRATMQPAPGYALAYLDWSAMEFGLAAALSRDHNMVAFYESGEPYLATARAAGAVPPGATKLSHPVERDLYKTGLLACQYGIGERSLARRIKRSVPFAGNFLQMHRDLFADYWRWSDGVVAEAIHSGQYRSRHGWSYAVLPPFNIRSLRNWPVQTTGADILRTACILADAHGIEMLATAHDAVLLQAPDDDIEAAATVMADCMQRASAIMTDGFKLRTSLEIRRAGDRFVEERGRRTLAIVDRFLEVSDGGGPRVHAAAE